MQKRLLFLTRYKILIYWSIFDKIILFDKKDEENRINQINLEENARKYIMKT